MDSPHKRTSRLYWMIWPLEADDTVNARGMSPSYKPADAQRLRVHQALVVSHAIARVGADLRVGPGISGKPNRRGHVGPPLQQTIPNATAPESAWMKLTVEL